MQLARRTAAVLGGAPGGIEELRRDGLLPLDGTLRLHLVRLEDDAEPGAETDPPARRLQLELSRLRHPRALVSGWEHGQVYVLESSRTPAELARMLAELHTARMVSRVRARGIGSVRLDDLPLAVALRRARFLADLAQLLDRGPDPLDWEEAGGWRLLLGWELASASVGALSPDAARLVQAGSAAHWPTLLAWLDNARSTNATSEQLFIHRATLHYRLSRSREVLGEGVLDDGWRTAALHVALKLHAALDTQDHQ